MGEHHLHGFRVAFDELVWRTLALSDYFLKGILRTQLDILSVEGPPPTKSLSENHFMALEQRRISPRMDSLISPFSKEMRLMKEATTTSRVDYFNLPRPLWRKLKKCLL